MRVLTVSLGWLICTLAQCTFFITLNVQSPFIANIPLQVICLFDSERQAADHSDQSYRYNTSQQEHVSGTIWRGRSQEMLNSICTLSQVL